MNKDTRLLLITRHTYVLSPTFDIVSTPSGAHDKIVFGNNINANTDTHANTNANTNAGTNYSTHTKTNIVARPLN